MTAGSHPPLPPAPDSARRTGAYLRLYGLGPREAAELSGRPLAEIQASLDAWAASLIPARPGESPLQQSVRGRAKILLARAPARWPGSFLRTPPPPELAAAVQAVVLQARRPIRQKAIMAPEPIDLGPVSEVADETWKTFDAWPVLRGLTTWLLFGLLLSAVFYVVRF